MGECKEFGCGHSEEGRLTKMDTLQCLSQLFAHMNHNFMFASVVQSQTGKDNNFSILGKNEYLRPFVNWKVQGKKVWGFVQGVQ